MKKVSDEILRENQNTRFMLSNCSSEYLTVYDVKSKDTVRV